MLGPKMITVFSNRDDNFDNAILQWIRFYCSEDFDDSGSQHDSQQWGYDSTFSICYEWPNSDKISVF